MLAKYLKMFAAEATRTKTYFIVEEVSGEMNDKKKLGGLVPGERALQAEEAPSIKALR